ncbi:MAG: VCBS repeat-containing protein [Fuerstiella sp.]|nr:VCBS repeat-containing protein [Fuerstiella sp.]MCP4788210.1 VCBS repeat-containing protein [Fuerstiella sp.]MCP4854634.1 VCBS repeat-containing protein [Fuerstiella sp.]
MSAFSELLIRQQRRVWVATALTLLWVIGCGTPTSDRSMVGPSTENSPPSDDIEEQVVHFCGDCHAMPRPESFPKDAWHSEVRRGFDFYVSSGRTDLNAPILAEVSRYFRERAPVTLRYTPSAASGLPSLFRPVAGLLQDTTGQRSVSFVSEHRDGPELSWWVSDMQQGTVSLLTMDGNTAWTNSSATSNPAVVRVCDLDGNGKQDLLCCDLGSFLPEDHDRGRLVWIRNRGTEQQQEVTLLNAVGRIADVRVADIDGDTDDDLVVAEFGWHKTGGIHLLENTGKSETGGLTFKATELDDRPGTIHVYVTHLNADTLPDIVALISQEHEQIVAFVNGEAGYSRTVLYQAPGPAYGSSGFSLVDIDRDGDEDMLYTNGDTFDSHLLKPYHSIAWLENKGELDFEYHHLATMPGVHRAMAMDFDLDGDIDIAAVALLPLQTLEQHSSVKFHGAIWLEQMSNGQFEEHVISSGDPIHATMALSDIDGDGDMDIVAGNMRSAQSRSLISLFENRAVMAKKPPAN